jgi:predicted heme/steroid binding protein/uncharacterized membrane protein
MQNFTEEELLKYDGSNGMPTYVAFKNRVYDVSTSNFWKNGKHFKKHLAGFDLTSAMALAPHGEEVFGRYQQVGELLKSTDILTENKKESTKERWRTLYFKYHPHPATVHFPIALHYFSAFADILFLAYPSAEYATAVFLSFVVATITGFFALIFGVLSWWINYEFAKTKPFIIKLVGAFFTLIIGFVPIAQKLINPKVAFSGGLGGVVYHSVIFITVLSVTIVGYYGGKITWRKS